MQDFFNEKLLDWQFQPIHNVYLLIFSEEGIIGIFLFLLFLLFIYTNITENVPRGTNKETIECSTWNKLKNFILTMFHVEHSEKEINQKSHALVNILISSIFFVILIIMLFDHYLFDIQQGQLILWIIFALAILNRRY
jgi:O-antigen ligase